MSTASELDPELSIKQERPRPLTSITASARRITTHAIRNRYAKATTASKDDWRNDAWDMFDLVGEERFLATTLAGRLAQAKFYVGKVSGDSNAEPEMLDDSESNIIDMFDAIGSSGVTRAQMIYRMGISLFVVGEGWLVGIPPGFLPKAQRGVEDSDKIADDAADLPLDSLQWQMLSVDEVVIHAAQETVTLKLGDGEANEVTCQAEQVYLIRVWRPHPRFAWDADSPTRSSLSVLRELVGLTMHISAQVDSRLAGAGMLLTPHSAQESIRQQMNLDADDDSDPFTENLIEAMLSPINDRSNASALVPLVVGVPDDAIEKFRYMTFDKPLDAEARTMRDDAIRRLALGQDAPPELLLGVGSMNHWGAWLVREDVVSTHLEPSLALICDALTSQYLWPVLEASGMGKDEIKSYVIWYDVSHLIMRPNHASDAKDLHDKGVINDAAVREASGFDETDAPIGSELSPPYLVAFNMIRSNPSLLTSPGLPAIVEQITALLNEDAIPVLPDTPAPADGEGQGDDSSPDPENNDGPSLIPDTDEDDAPEGEDMPTPGSSAAAAASAVAPAATAATAATAAQSFSVTHGVSTPKLSDIEQGRGQ